MMDYNPAENKWNDFFTNSTTGNLSAGKGFALRVGGTDAAVTYSGTPLAGNQTISDLIPASWNCIGNPFTSAIHINSASYTDNFLTLNGITNTNIDPAYGVYVWEKPDANNGQADQYTAISNVSSACVLQRGQGFFVKMNTGKTSVSFTSALQTHQATLTLKSAETQWPTIQLQAEINGLKSSTLIAFNQNMSLGLDPTYDAGLLKGNSELSVYTKLVEDYGIPFAIQALPDYDFENLVIPVGIDSKAAGEVVFSANLTNLPADCMVILEDKSMHKFTNLSENNYPVSIGANASISDRFFIHTSYTTTGINENTPVQITAYAVNNSEIRIEGYVNENAVATLFDIQGRTLISKKLNAGNINILPATSLKEGVYILKLLDAHQIQGFKIPVR
jgi:carbonic anhydrase/acetyltransferase-like protein (isoleucine patch superfamily)